MGVLRGADDGIAVVVFLDVIPLRVIERRGSVVVEVVLEPTGSKEVIPDGVIDIREDGRVCDHGGEPAIKDAMELGADIKAGKVENERSRGGVLGR